MHELPLPRGIYSNPVWPSVDKVFVVRGVQFERDWAPPVADVVVASDPKGMTFHQVTLPHEPGCRRVTFMRLRRSADGRLLLERGCERWPAPPEITLVAYHPDTGDVEDLATLDDSVLYFTWDPVLEHGYYSTGSGICEWIRRMDRTRGALPVDIAIEHEGVRHPLDEAAHLIADADCVDTIRATAPELSPDGKVLAFLASPRSIGLSGGIRLDVPWELYLVDATTPDEPVPHVAGIVAPRGIAWSPDGRFIALSGDIDDHEGTWLYEAASKRLDKIASVILGTPSWAHDGRGLIGYLPSNSDDPLDLSTRVGILDLTRLLLDDRD